MLKFHLGPLVPPPTDTRTPAIDTSICQSLPNPSDGLRVHYIMTQTRELNPLWFILLSASSYLLCFRIVADAMYAFLPESPTDHSAMVHWGVLVALMVWLFGPSLLSFSMDISQQLRWWAPLVFCAAIHAMAIVLLVAQLLSSGQGSVPTSGIALVLPALIATAAAMAYGLFLLVSSFLVKQAARRLQ